MMMHNLERTLDEMVDKARLEGKEEGKLELIKKLVALGVRDVEILSKASDLPAEEIQKLIH
ncbi:putative transposase/invertase (TIGR01784 family) [Aneurinibacillus soli]|uniref:Uncharacterized protein n=3 Tax=Aneurinibacillus soli TaxID=1500254 RepID=A0A0U5AXJ7_9BACL|nr:putative transposase/invertase (TIGR01784 family) [Aneurinibacillus soli]BAU28469.1 hypothetical protein CB4_02643 [Aneurinibacillus soli]